MLDFIIFILSTIGLTFIVTQFYIFRWLRNFICKYNKFLGKLLHCTGCFGFWAAMLIKTLMLIYYNNLILLSLIIIPIYGFIGSFVCYLTYLLIKPLMDKYD
jgi:hypothetical protein